MKIGLVLPNSAYVPRLAAGLTRWLALGLGDGGAQAETVAETGGYNEKSDIVRAKIERLTMLEDADLIVAPLNPVMPADLAGTMAGQETPLLALTMGEDVCKDDCAPPWAFQISFGLWRSVWLTAFDAVRRSGPRLGVVASLHDGGYGLAFAAQLGAESAGGTLIMTPPLPQPARPADAAARLADLRAERVDAVLLLASCGDLDLLAGAWQAGAEPAVPAFGLPPFRVAPGPVAEAAGLARRTYASWRPAARLPDGASAAAAGRPVHPYHLLAWEAGRMVAAAVAGLAGAAPADDRAGWRAALAAAQIGGPRGALAFDPATQEAVAGQHPLEIGPTGAIQPARAEMPLDLLEEHVGLTRAKIAKQGWLNPFHIA